jgi:hypothetical protein
MTRASVWNNAIASAAESLNMSKAAARRRFAAVPLSRAPQRRYCRDRRYIRTRPDASTPGQGPWHAKIILASINRNLFARALFGERSVC